MRTLLPLFVLTGCIPGLGGTEIASDDIVIHEVVDTLYVDVGGGDLSVRVADVAQVELRRLLQYSGDRPALIAEVRGSTLTVEVDCRGGIGVCRVDHEILLPKSVPVWLDTSSGDIVVENLADDLDVRTGSGSVSLQLVGQRQMVVVESGSGDLRVEGDPGWVELTTGSGDVRLGTGLRPDQVLVDTGSGDVHLDLPADTYAIRTKTRSGDVEVINLDVSPGDSHRIEVETGSGDITLRGF